MLSRLMTLVSRIRVILFIVALILVTVFLVQNTGTLQVHFLIFDAKVPTVILILVAALLGFFAGYLYAMRFRWRHSS